LIGYQSGDSVESTRVGGYGFERIANFHALDSILGSNHAHGTEHTAGVEMIVAHGGVFCLWECPLAELGHSSEYSLLRRPENCHGARAAMSRVQRLKRVFNIDVDIYRAFGGAFKVIACIEDPVAIEKILAHLPAHSGAAQRIC